MESKTERRLRPEVKAALELLEKTTREPESLRETDSHVLANIGAAYRALGMTADSDRLFDRSVQLAQANTNHRWPDYHTASLLLLNGRESHGQELIQGWIDRFNPTRSRIVNHEYKAAFFAYLGVERYAEALDVLRHWPNRVPESIFGNRPDRYKEHCYGVLAVALAQQGDFSQSHAIAEANMNSGHIWARIAVEAARRGYSTEASFALDKAKENTIDLDWWFDDLIYAHVALGDFEQANRLIQKTRSSEASIVNESIEYYARHGNFQKAIDLAESIGPSDEAHPHADLRRLSCLIHVAQFQAKSGDKDSAHALLLRAWHEANATRDTQQALGSVARALAQAGFRNDAVEAYRDVYRYMDSNEFRNAHRIKGSGHWPVVVAYIIEEQAKADLAYE